VQSLPAHEAHHAAEDSRQPRLRSHLADTIAAGDGIVDEKIAA
jgi:aspartate oxidase